MNERGLGFDGASTPRVSLKFSPEKKSYRGYLPDKIMGECATVEEVIAVAREYRFSGLRGQGQLLFADATGDAVILGGPDKDGDLDIIRKDRDIMVLTNFFPNHPDMGGYPCLRFRSATHHLEQDPRPTKDNFRHILETVSSKYTQYSNVFDLNNRIIWLYHQRDFAQGIELRLQDELAKGAHAYRIHHLFGKPREGEGLAEINKLRREGRISRRIPRFIAFR
jgi:choloylglycine hydrolase